MQVESLRHIVEDLNTSNLLGRGGFGYQFENRIVGDEDYTFVQTNGDQFYIRLVNSHTIDFITCDYVEIEGSYRLVGYVENECRVKEMGRVILRVVNILKMHKAFSFRVDIDRFAVMARELGIQRDMNVFSIDFKLRIKSSTNCDVC